MNKNIDIKELWTMQTTNPSNTDDLFLKLNQMKKAYWGKLIITNILLIATSVFIVFIWVHYQPQLLTSKVGIVLIILAMVIYLFVYNQLNPSLKKINFSQSNNEYLKTLLSIKSKQHFLQTTMLNIYFALLLFGISLYMFEPTSRMTKLWAVVAYALTLTWIGFNWFYIRPKTIKKQQNKLDEIISKFENIIQQLKEE